jgi:hypothetical protein
VLHARFGHLFAVLDFLLSHPMDEGAPERGWPG